MSPQSKRRLPAEWESQEGVLLCFPADGKDWPGKYRAIQWAFIDFIKKIAEVEKVYLLVAHQTLRDRVSKMLDEAHVAQDNVQIIELKTNRSWMRDSGPIIVKNGDQREAIQFQFNGWAKYANYRLDRAVPAKVANHLGIPLTPARYWGTCVVLEGGAIDSNGQGTLLSTHECLLHASIQVRNPGFKQEDYENIFEEYLGIEQVIWLGDGIEGDDTHGHVDDLARFVNPDTIVAVEESHVKDPNHQPLLDNLRRLKRSSLASGAKPNVITLPMPRPIYFQGMRMPASYANFLIINQMVLVPTFNDKEDRTALNILGQCFPDRTVIGLHSLDLIWGFGATHCLSQQIPV